MIVVVGPLTKKGKKFDGIPLLLSIWCPDVVKVSTVGTPGNPQQIVLTHRPLFTFDAVGFSCSHTTPRYANQLKARLLDSQPHERPPELETL